MKKYIITGIILLLVGLFILINKINKNDNINDLLDIYHDIFNNNYIGDTYSYNGTINYEYHYTDPHGGTSTTYSDSIKYKLSINNNQYYLNLYKDNFESNMLIDNSYINEYFILKNISKDILENLYYNINSDNNTELFNELFKTNYKDIKLNKKGFINKKYELILDNDKLIIDKNSIIFYKEDNKVIDIKINKNNTITITFDNNTISIIKENDDKYKYICNINDTPFEITKNKDNIFFQINYPALKYNDLRLSTKYEINDNINTSIKNNNDDYLNQIPLYEYYSMIKEIKD